MRAGVVAGSTAGDRSHGQLVFTFNSGDWKGALEQPQMAAGLAGLQAGGQAGRPVVKRPVCEYPLPFCPIVSPSCIPVSLSACLSCSRLSVCDRAILSMHIDMCLLLTAHNSVARHQVAKVFANLQVYLRLRIGIT